MNTNGPDLTAKARPGDPTVVACVIFQTQDPERVVELLRHALTGIPDQAPSELSTTASLSAQKDSEDLWLRHAEAAQYLGVSKSTLYHCLERTITLCNRTASVVR